MRGMRVDTAYIMIWVSPSRRCMDHYSGTHQRQSQMIRSFWVTYSVPSIRTVLIFQAG